MANEETGKTGKEVLAVKVPAEWKEKIKDICTDLGVTPSEWLSDLIGEALAIAPSRVKSLPDRVAALEKKLARLAN